MTGKVIATRYARALINIARQKGIIEKIQAELLYAAKVYQADGLPKLLLNPLISYQDKRVVLQRILKDSVSPVLTQFLETLLRKRRIEYLADIAEIYGILSDQARGVIRVKATSAFPLAEPEKNKLLAKLNRITNKQVVLTTEINRALLGGLLVQVGDTVIDGSVRGRLRKMREQILQ